MLEDKKQKYNNYFAIKDINPVIRFLTLSDFIIIGSFGLISPIFAIFIVENIQGGTIEVAGIAYAIFFLSESLFQIPLAAMLDKIKGERDDFWALFIGSLIFSLIPIAYIFISRPIHLYLVQFFYGLAVALAGPAWFAIFTRHIDRNREGLEWGIYRTLINIGAAITASLGGFLALRFGFQILFVIISILSFLGSCFILGVYRHMRIGKVLRKN